MNAAGGHLKLPVVICEPDEAWRARCADIVDEVARREYPSLRLEFMPGAHNELLRTLSVNSGIMLVLLSITEAAAGGIDGCVQLYASVMARNRENYVLIFLDDTRRLDEVLSRCMRPAGVLVRPPREELMRAVLRRVFNDYLALHEAEPGGGYMLVTASGASQRVAYRDILYMEAQNKTLNICLRHYALTVRATLNELERTLPEGFLRCHRSYIVNCSYIKRFDASQMMLELTTGERLNVSRSCKAALLQALKGDGRK